MTAATDAVTVPGAPVPARWTTGTWKIDPAHTTAGFAVRHLMSRVRGTFSEISGQIVTDPHPSRSTATATIALSSVSTGNDERDAHLLSKEAT
jgi:polyisoprenoid-binding protein YceI